MLCALDPISPSEVNLRLFRAAHFAILNFHFSFFDLPSPLITPPVPSAPHPQLRRDNPGTPATIPWSGRLSRPALQVGNDSCKNSPRFTAMKSTVLSAALCASLLCGLFSAEPAPAPGDGP